MEKYSDRGFVIVEALLVLVVIGLLAGAGWYIWQQNADTYNSQPGRQSSIDGQARNENLANKEGEFDCHGDFVVTIPKHWNAYYLDEGNCVVTDVQKSELPPVGKLGGENVSMVFSAVESSISLNDFANAEIEEIDATYPIDIISRENIKLNSGNDALILLTEGGHYSTRDYQFYTRKGNLIISTAWRADSKLADQSRQTVLTVK